MITDYEIVVSSLFEENAHDINLLHIVINVSHTHEAILQNNISFLKDFNEL